MTPEPDPDTLPLVLGHVMRALGYDAALRLARALGGQVVYVPHHAAGSALEQRVGEDIARVMSAQWPGEPLRVPSFHARQAAERRKAVLMNEKKSVNVLARELGISTRQIHKIRASGRNAPSGQLSLFPDD